MNFQRSASVEMMVVDAAAAVVVGGAAVVRPLSPPIDFLALRSGLRTLGPSEDFKDSRPLPPPAPPAPPPPPSPPFVLADP